MYFHGYGHISGEEQFLKRRLCDLKRVVLPVTRRRQFDKYQIRLDDLL